MKNVIVIGGGPAGMIAAGIAAANGASVILLEKNEKLGKKLYITGKGRCNLTNNTDIQGLLSQTISNPRFMQSAYNTFSPADLIEFFENLGTPLKTERGNRVFPVSDKAEDITKTLARYMKKHGVKVELNCEVKNITTDGEKFTITTNKSIILAHSVIIATGGLSYPSTGSTGDGFKFAKNLSHTVTPTFPSIVPINVAEPWVAELTGLSLRNVCLTVRQPGQRPIYSEGSIAGLCPAERRGMGQRPIYNELGEMLFTPTGVTGPLVLRASAFITEKLADTTPLRLEIDLKPALSNEQLDARILRDFAESQNKNFANALDGLLPKRLISTVITLSEIPPQIKVNAITKKQRQNLVSIVKALPLTPTKTADYREAVITRGGITVKEINPSTMMSKKHSGLFFAGEVLDVDAMTGGYNLQIAFSTGFVAGKNAAK